MSVDITTAFTTLANTTFTAINDTLPIILPVFGGIVAIGIGLKLFKKMTGRA